MGILDAAIDSFGGMLQDQWKDIVTAAPFDEKTLVAKGIRKRQQEERGLNLGLDDVLSNGSLIFVPENTVATIYDQGGIEQFITTPGRFEYRNGEASIFDEQNRSEKGIGSILVDQTARRIGFSGMAQSEKRIAFVNMREIRGVKFGTRGPLAYHDRFYDTDLEVYSYGSFTVRVTDPVTLMRNFVPANTFQYSLADLKSREQLTAEFLHSFIAAVNQLSFDHRISQLPSQANAIAKAIVDKDSNAGSWPVRYGLALQGVAIENIEFSDASRKLIQGYAEKKMGVAAFEGASQHAANIAAQQIIAEGIRENGLGDGGGMLFGMNLANQLNPQNASPANTRTIAAETNTQAQSSIDDQIETVKKLKELADAGILTEQEFEAKKKDVLGL